MRKGNNLADLDPRAVILALGLASSFPIFWNTWAAVALSGGFLVTFAFLHGIRLKQLVVRTLSVSWFAAYIILINSVTKGGHILFEVSGMFVTSEGLVQGMKLSSQLVMLLWGSSILIWSIPAPRLVDAFSSSLPSGSGSLIMLITVTMNLVPGFLLQSKRIRLSLLARGTELSGIRNKLRFVTLAALPLFAASARTANQLGVAMQSRGYDPSLPRSSFFVLRVRREELVLIAVAAGVTVAGPIIVSLSGL